MAPTLALTEQSVAGPRCTPWHQNNRVSPQNMMGRRRTRPAGGCGAEGYFRLSAAVWRQDTEHYRCSWVCLAARNSPPYSSEGRRQREGEAGGDPEEHSPCG